MTAHDSPPRWLIEGEVGTVEGMRFIRTAPAALTQAKRGADPTKQREARARELANTGRRKAW